MTDQKHVNIPLPGHTHRALKATAAAQGVSLKRLIQTTLDQAIDGCERRTAQPLNAAERPSKSTR